MCLKTVPKPEKRNYDHFRPISGRALRVSFAFHFLDIEQIAARALVVHEASGFWQSQADDNECRYLAKRYIANAPEIT